MSNHAANEGFADPARIEFLQRYKAFLISTNTRGYEVPPVTWAMLWLAPLERLENDIDGLNTKFSELETSGLIALWQQKKKKDEETIWSSPADHATPPLVHSSPLGITPLRQTAAMLMPPPPPPQPAHEPITPTPRKKKRTVSQAELSSLGSPTSPATRAQQPVQQTLARDKFRCAISGLKSCTEVAHIYPHSMHPEGRLKKSVAVFWDLLLCFWGRQQFEEWHSCVIPNGIDVPSNMLLLQPTLHGLWSRGRYALKPISKTADGKSFEVQFWWLKANPRSERVDLTSRPDISHDENEPTFIAVTRPPTFVTPQILKSGDTFVWTTDDPTARPLPSFALLHLQWHLQRIAAIAAAGEQLDSDGESDDDDEEVFDPLEALHEEDKRRQAGLELGSTSKLPNRAADPGIQPFIT